jgi:tRNA splicing ligase
MSFKEEDNEEPIAALKQEQTTSLAAVTRRRTSLVKLMLKEENLHIVKTEIDEYDESFLEYQRAHHVLFDALTSEDIQDKEAKL